MTHTITVDVLATAVQLTKSAESQLMCNLKTQQSNLSRVLFVFPNTPLDFADDAMGFVHVWDFLLCFAVRTREVPGLRLVKRQRSQGLYNRALFSKVGYVKDKQKGTRGTGGCRKYG